MSEETQDLEVTQVQPDQTPGEETVVAEPASTEETAA